MGVAADLEAEIGAGGMYHQLTRNAYILDRPVLVTADGTEIDARGSSFACQFNANSAGHDAFVFAPAAWLPTPGPHFSVDGTTGRYAFRPKVGDVYAGIAFWGTGLNRPRVSGTDDGYEHVTRLRAHLWLRRHTANWTAHHNIVIFGMRGSGVNHPGPFWVGFSDGALYLRWRDSTGENHDCALTVPAGNPAEVRCTFDVNLTTGAWAGYHNDTEVATGRFTAGLTLENDRCQVGHMAASINDGGYVSDQNASGADFSFLGASVVVNQPVATDATQFWSGLGTGQVWSWWNENLGVALSGQFSRWWGSLGFGAGLVVKAIPDVARIVNAGIFGLRVKYSSPFGSGVACWAGDHFKCKDVDVTGGACGVSSPGQPSNSYPFHVENVRLYGQATAGIAFNFTDLSLTGVNKIQTSKLAFLLGRTANLAVDHLFTSTGQEVPANTRFLVKVEQVVRCRLRDVTVNIEVGGGLGTIRDAYFWFSASRDAGAGDVSVILEHCTVQGISGSIPAVRLVGSPSPGRRAALDLRTPIGEADRASVAYVVTRTAIAPHHLVADSGWSV